MKHRAPVPRVQAVERGAPLSLTVYLSTTTARLAQELTDSKSCGNCIFSLEQCCAATGFESSCRCRPSVPLTRESRCMYRKDR